MAKNDRTTAGPYWTRNWIEKMWRFTAENFVDFDTGAVDFEALGREEYEFRKALFYRKFKNSERAREAFVESEDLYKVNVERGKKGGRPRKNPEEPIPEVTGQGRTGAPSTGATSSTAPVRSLTLPTTEQLYDFARAENLDEADARDWYEMTVVDRNGNDRDGNPIGNWKGAIKRFCKNRAAKRSKGEVK